MLWSPYTAKPIQGTPIDASRGLGNQIVLFYPLWEGCGNLITDAASRVALTVSSAASWSSGATLGLLCAASNAGATGPLPASAQIQPPCTLATSFRLVATPANIIPIFGTAQSSSSLTRVISIEMNDSSVSFFLNAEGGFSGTAATVGTDNTAALSISSAGIASVYLNGKLINTYSGYTSLTWGSSSPVAIFGGQAFAINRNLEGLIYWGGFWSRALSQTEVQALGVNPWQIFGLDRRMLAITRHATSGGGGLIVNPYQRGTYAYRRRMAAKARSG